MPRKTTTLIFFFLKVHLFSAVMYHVTRAGATSLLFCCCFVIHRPGSRQQSVIEHIVTDERRGAMKVSWTCLPRSSRPVSWWPRRCLRAAQCGDGISSVWLRTMTPPRRVGSAAAPPPCYAAPHSLRASSALHTTVEVLSSMSYRNARLSVRKS